MASKHRSVPSACNDSPVFTSSASWGRQPNEGVSLMKVSALGCPSRLPITSFPTMDIMELTDVKDTVTLYRCRHLMLSMWNISLLMVTLSTRFSSTSKDNFHNPYLPRFCCRVKNSIALVGCSLIKTYQSPIPNFSIETVNIPRYCSIEQFGNIHCYEFLWI